MKKILHFSLMFLIIALLAACGGGTSQTAAPSTNMKAVIKASALSANLNIGGVDMTIALPSGIKPIMNADGSVNATDSLEFTSQASASYTLQKITYNPNDSTLEFSVVNLAGFGVTDDIVLHLLVSPGTIPIASDFAIKSSAFYDKDSGAVITGLNPTLTTTIK